MKIFQRSQTPSTNEDKSRKAYEGQVVAQSCRGGEQVCGVQVQEHRHCGVSVSVRMGWAGVCNDLVFSIK